MKIAYLCCPATLPNANPRHPAAHMHDEMTNALRAALAADADGTLEEVSWDDANADWASFDAAMIGSTWDYTDRHDEFLAGLAKIETQIRLFNSMLFVRWNCNKTYLRDFSLRGVDTVATIWLPNPSKAALETALKTIGTDDIVIKPQIGAGAVNQYRLSSNDPLPSFSQPMMAQPFVPSIQTEGEYSFIYIDNEFSHAVVKTPATDDYRVQPHYGGTTKAFEPSPEDLAAADKAMDILEDKPLIARIDMVRLPDGHLVLMEAELIEPYLFPDLCPDVAVRIVKGLKKQLAT